MGLKAIEGNISNSPKVSRLYKNLGKRAKFLLGCSNLLELCVLRFTVDEGGGEDNYHRVL